jgi:phage baseplate assembly protein gpV
MRFNLYDSEEEKVKIKPTYITSIATGVVQENLDLPMFGRILVRIPSIDMEVWARQLAPGAGSKRGFVFFPKKGDEVIVAFNQEDPNDAYVIGSLWSPSKQPPIDLPFDVKNKTILKTEAGHVVEFDDTLRSITITTSDQQKIKMSKLEGILIDNLTNQISLGAKGEIDIKGPAGSISISTSGGVSVTGTSITLNAPNIEIKGTNITITGANVKIN